jgi:hypothetical protein
MSNIIGEMSVNEITYYVYTGLDGRYYVIDDIKYSINFPIVWALDHKSYIKDGIEIPDSRSGPKDCLNCKEFGKINGLFAFYCANCAEYVYNGTRRGIEYYNESTITTEQIQDTVD